MADGDLTLSADGQVYATTDPPGAGSFWSGGYCFSADGHLHITTTSSSGDFYIGGSRFAPNGALVVGPGLPPARPYIYNNGLPFDKTNGALIRQENQTPSASDSYVHGIRVGPLGGVYMITNAAVIPPEIIAAPSITTPVYPGVQVVYSVGSANEGAVVSAYLWTANSVTVATTQNYTPTLADATKDLQVRITWTNTGGSTSSTSPPATVSSAVPITVTQAPVYSQYPIVGVLQSYTAGTATSNPAPTKTIQWLSGGVAISGATAATYTPVTGDLAKLLSVRETWSNGYATPVSSTSAGQLVTPAMAAGTNNKYIDVTLGADDGGPYVDGAAYTPSFPLADGSVAPAGNIYATCTSAYNSAGGNGNRYYCRKGYYHDPVGGVFFTTIFTRSNTLFSSYGPTQELNPILDGLVYLTGSAGWTPNATIQGAWDYALTGVTADNNLTARLWVNRRNSGNRLPERNGGTARRRATTLANLSLTNGAPGSGLWYVTAGSPSTLTVMADVDNAPPVYWNGIGLNVAGFTPGTSRGIHMRQPASNNRVQSLRVLGCYFRQMGVSDLNADGTCSTNVFVDTAVYASINSAYYVGGASALRNVVDTYLSKCDINNQSSAQESDDTNQYTGPDGYSLTGFSANTYCANLTAITGNCHTIIDTRLVSNQPPVNVQIDGLDITWIPGATYGRGFDGFFDTGFIRNFVFTGMATRCQLAGLNFEVYDGVVNDMQQNFSVNDSINCFSFNKSGFPTGVQTSNFKVHDVLFNLSASPCKSPIWYESNSATPNPAANATEVNNCRCILNDTQGLVVNGSHGGNTIWPNQNIHDNVIVNANLIGQNFSTTNSSATTPTFTTQPLNGYMGCVNNTVVAN